MIKGEIKPLTGLRAIAASWVVIFHIVSGRKETFYSVFPWADTWLQPLISAGQLGVDLFFVLSGFVLAFNYLDRMGDRMSLSSTRRFFWARLARVWPVYFVMLNVAGLIELALSQDKGKGGLPDEFSPMGYFWQVILAQQWFSPRHEGTSWNGPAWTVSCEALAYLLFPFFAVVIARIAGTAGPRLLAVLAVAVMAPRLLIIMSTDSFGSEYSWILRIMCEFLAGMLAYCFVSSVDWTAGRRRLAGVGSVTLTAVVVAALYMFDEAWLSADWGLVAVLFVPLIACLAAGGGPIAWLLATRPLLLGGYISYSLYLVHIPFFHLARDLARPIRQQGAEPFMYYCLFLMPVAFVVAWLMWRFVEEPARLRMRAMVAPPAAPARASAAPPPATPRVESPVAR